MIKKISCNGSIYYKTTFIKTIKENFSIHNKVRKPQPFKISQFSGDWEAIKIYFLFFYIYQDLSILCKYLFILFMQRTNFCMQAKYEYHNPLTKCELYSNNINKNKL